MKTKKLLILIIPLLIMGTYTLSQDVKDVVAGNNEFTFSLYDQINNEDENVFFSPYSISSALAMTYNGARKTTKKEMADVMNFNENEEVLSKSFSELNNHITNLSSEKIQLDIANSIWGQQDYGFEKRFLELNNKYYGAGVKEVNFKENYKSIRKDINKWVEDKTQEKIKDLIKKNMLDPMTKMVLVNAIYFNGKWQFPFEEEDTYEDKFFIYSECETKVDFMHREVSLKYHEDDLAQIVEIPYSGDSLSMMVVLPKERYGMEQLEDHLDEELYESYQKSMVKKKVKLTLPKFKITAGYELNDPLKNLGMESAFNSNADFSGMTGKKDLYISNVVHESFVEVNEEGTEAAAATGVVMRKTSVNPEKKEFKADHPFVFFIKDNEKGTILFMGRIMNPEK
ncbi:MAG: serpin family protein [Bacteroidota bacterium]